MTDPERKEAGVLEELRALDDRLTRLEAGLQEEKRVASILHHQIREEIARNREEAARRYEDAVATSAARHQEVLGKLEVLQKGEQALASFKEQLNVKVGILWALFGAAASAAAVKLLNL